MDTELDKYKH